MIKKIVAVIVVIVIVAVGVVAYWAFRPPAEASAPIEAIPITVEIEESAAADPATNPADEPASPVEAAVDETEPVEAPEVRADPAVEAVEEDEAAVEPEVQADTGDEVGAAGSFAPAAEVEDEANAESEIAAAAEAEASNPTGEEAATASLIFEIVPSDSEARFVIDEVLRGDPVTVVGTTDQVAGQFALNPSDLSTAQAGVIQVNARTLATDNNFRNRAIKNFILLTDDFEFVTFTPTEIVGLPEQGTIGETYSFQITGDLTITDATQPVTFDVTATPVSPNRIEAIASTSVLYTDFGLFIPDAPAVDTVDDVVRLELAFVAEAL